MTMTWILVAHGSSAKLLKVSKSGEEIATVKEFFHPRTAKKDRVDKKGELAHNAIDYSGDMEKHERVVFAKDIVDFLAKAHSASQFERLIMVVSPDLLGDLRKDLPNHVTRAITHELNRDLLSQRYTDAELVKKIKDDLNLVCF